MDFRMYDNAIGKFYGMDALSEKNHYLSPFQFADGNPVLFSDPSGLDALKYEHHHSDAPYDNGGMEHAIGGGGGFDVFSVGGGGGGGGAATGGGSGGGDGFGPDFSNEDGINVVVLPANIPAGDEAMNNIMASALKDLNADVLVLFVTGIEDLVKQLKDNNVKLINNLINCSHGNYEGNSFKVGNDKLIEKKDFQKLGKALNPFVNSATNIILHSCHSGGGKDLKISERNMKAIGDSSGANVFGLMTWGKGSSNLFNDRKGAVGKIPKQYKKNWTTNRVNAGLYINTYKMYSPRTASCPGSFSFINTNIKYQKDGSIEY